MKIRVLKLGTECRDRATELDGTITHWVCDMGTKISYLFQPRGLNEEGQPVQRLYLSEERLDITGLNFEDIEVPFEILGTTVTDKASGFTGMAVEFVRHINGCFHVVIQPAGRLAKNNTPVKAYDFDLRGCTGEKIVELTEPQLKRSHSATPSPTGDSFTRAIPLGESFPTRA